MFLDIKDNKPGLIIKYWSTFFLNGIKNKYITIFYTSIIRICIGYKISVFFLYLTTTKHFQNNFFIKSLPIIIYTLFFCNTLLFA